MKKYIVCSLLALFAFAENGHAQGYHIYKNGAKQTYKANEMDSLVFFKDSETDEEYVPVEDENNPTASKGATKRTADKNEEWYDILDFTDMSELENAKRGCIEATPDLVIRNAKGEEVWNMQAFNFLHQGGAAPSTVNPSLWQNALCNVQCGLFEVLPDKIYQVRGYDMANMTFIKTDHGWIIFDTMMGMEGAKAGIELFKKHKGDLTVVAVIVSHSHVDHYGGMAACLEGCKVADSSLPLEEQIKPGKSTAIIVPEGFMKHVISENAYVGTAMGRRAAYQYGAYIPKGVTGRMAMGIGMGECTNYTGGLLAPTFEIGETKTYNIDGLTVTFQITPGTEAPAEMNAYFKEYRALWMAENCTGTLHNLYTLRGAQVRDAEAWCDYILEAETMFADSTDVVFQSHNWPHWGTETIKEYLENNAAIYKFIHDQTLHFVNLGFTSAELADNVKLPAKLNKVWYTRQYYGTLSHNIRAVYQKYLGWYDANPVNLDPLTPVQTAKKWVEYLGDVDRVLRLAREDFAKGEYQWVAQVTKELVFADPSNMEARRLCADALEQLGYQSESGTWRNAYLTGALDLRAGTPTPVFKSTENIINQLSAGTIDMLIEYSSIKNNVHDFEDYDVVVNFIIGDEKCCVVRRNGVILNYKNQTRAKADATARGTKEGLLNYFKGNHTGLDITGSEEAVISIMPTNINAWSNFNIIEP